MKTSWKGRLSPALLPWIAVCLFALALPFLPFFHPLLSPDSLHYADIARTLVRGGGLATWHLHLGSRAVPDPFLYWPPLYPAALAGGLKLGLGIEGAFRLVTSLSLLVSALGVFWASLLFRGRGFALLCGAAWLAFWPFQKFWFHAWSEIPFTALSALLLAFLARPASRPSSPWWFLPAGCAAGLAVLCRYPGVAALLPAALALFLVSRKERVPLLSPSTLARAALFLVPFLLLVLPWLLRNLSLGGPFGPPRKPALEGALFFQGVSLFKATLRLLYLPAGAALLLAFLGRWAGKEESPRTRWNKEVLLLHLAFLASYGALLLVLGGLIRFDRIRSRLAGPMLVSLLPLALACGWEVSRRSWKKVPSPGGLPFLGVILAAAWAGGILLRGFPSGGDKRMLPPPVKVWIEKNTPGGALVVAPRGWWVPYQTGRPVLESGYPEQKPLSPEGVEAFLARFGGRFPGVYLLVQEDLAEAVSLAAELTKEGKAGPALFRAGRWRIYLLR